MGLLWKTSTRFCTEQKINKKYILQTMKMVEELNIWSCKQSNFKHSHCGIRTRFSYFSRYSWLVKYRLKLCSWSLKLTISSGLYSLQLPLLSSNQYQIHWVNRAWSVGKTAGSVDRRLNCTCPKPVSAFMSSKFTLICPSPGSILGSKN